MIQEAIISALVTATGIDRDPIAKAVVRAKDTTHGDFAFPCFIVAKALKLAPPQCAQKLAAELKLPAGIAKVEAAGPYLNFFLDRTAVTKDVIDTIIAKKFDYAKGGATESVLIEYSAPNIAKILHVGHLRNTLLGSSLDRIYRFLGYKVTSINYLGDWGTQFGFTWAGCELWGKPENPSVDTLVDVYIRASKLRKDQEEKTVDEADKDKPDVNQMARDYFKRLESGDKDAVAFWQWCLDLSMDYFNDIYKRLNIKFDHFLGESFFKDKMSGVEKLIRESGILEESRGALGVDLGKKLGFVRVFTEDGRSLYITRDIANALYRYDTWKPDRILYVVGSQQTFYFEQLIALLKKMKHPVADLMVHIPYGWVPGMKTREGGATSLREFLDEARSRALTTYREEVQRRPEGLDEDVVAEAVSIGATYFYFLSVSNSKDLNFSWKEALTFQGDSGPYVQYALARLYSIETKAAEVGIKVGPWKSEDLATEDSYELVSLLASFRDVVEKAAREYEPSHLTSYLLDVAKAFSGAYRKLRVIGEPAPIASARLALFVATKYVLHTGLSLIGVPPVERM
jgi:arginyl-tRNA synthetase